MKINNRIALALSTVVLSSASVAATPFTEASSAQSSQDWSNQEFVAQDNNSGVSRDRIEDEVNRILFRSAVSLNAVLVAFIGLFIALAGVTLWFQLAKLRQQTERHKQELESFQADTLSHIKEAIAEAEGVLSAIDERVVYSEEVILQARTDALTELRAIAEDTHTARDQIYKKLAEFLPRLVQYANTQPATNGQATQQNGNGSATPQPAPTRPQTFTLTAADYLKQGDVLFLETRYQDAVNFYDKAIQTQENFPEAWNNRGGALTKLQKYEDAIASYDRAIALKPDFPQAWNNRGGTLVKLQRADEAIESYLKAVEFKADDPLIWLNLGNALLKRQRLEEAVAAYDRAIHYRTDDPLIWLNRGNALAKLKRYEAALNSYDQALQIKPQDSEVWYSRGYVFYEMQQYEDALTSYEESLKYHADRPDSWNNRGNVLERLQRYPEAIESYNRALQIQPNKYESWDNRGYSLVKLGRYPEALASFDRALKIKPDHANAYYNKAFCYAAQGDIKASLTHLHRAIKLNSLYRDVAKNDPDLESVRSHQVFQRLVNGQIPVAS